MKNGTIYFWKPTQGDVTTCLTQWYIAPFRVDGTEYACAEQYMMAQKAILFDDKEMLPKIMATTDPGVMKKLGRQVKNYDEKKWEDHRIEIVTKGNISKFTDPRNKELKEYLLSTGEAQLVEASPLDRIWGIGLDAAKASTTPPSEWPGKNLLGKILMDVRERLGKNQPE